MPVRLEVSASPLSARARGGGVLRLLGGPGERGQARGGRERGDRGAGDPVGASGAGGRRRRGGRRLAAARGCEGWPTGSRRSAAPCAWRAVPGAGTRLEAELPIVGGGAMTRRARSRAIARGASRRRCAAARGGAIRRGCGSDRGHRAERPGVGTGRRLRQRRSPVELAAGALLVAAPRSRAEARRPAPLSPAAGGRRHRLAPLRVEQSRCRPRVHSGARALRGLAALLAQAALRGPGRAFARTTGGGAAWSSPTRRAWECSGGASAAVYDPLAQGCLGVPGATACSWRGTARRLARARAGRPRGSASSGSPHS